MHLKLFFQTLYSRCIYRFYRFFVLMSYTYSLTFLSDVFAEAIYKRKIIIKNVETYVSSSESLKHNIFNFNFGVIFINHNNIDTFSIYKACIPNLKARLMEPIKRVYLT